MKGGQTQASTVPAGLLPLTEEGLARRGVNAAAWLPARSLPERMKLNVNLLHFSFDIPRTPPNPSVRSACCVLAGLLPHAPAWQRLPHIHPVLGLCWASARPRWALLGLRRPSSSPPPVFFSSHKSCYTLLENWRSVILSGKRLKKLIHQSAVAFILCPHANAAPANKSTQPRENRIAEGQLALLGAGGISISGPEKPKQLKHEMKHNSTADFHNFVDMFCVDPKEQASWRCGVYPRQIVWLGAVMLACPQQARVAFCAWALFMIKWMYWAYVKRVWQHTASEVPIFKQLLDGNALLPSVF